MPNITFEITEGSGIIHNPKKRRGRKKKEVPSIEKQTEVIVKELLPHQKFSHKKNKALDQLLEANREKERKAFEENVKLLARASLGPRGGDLSEPEEEIEIPPFFMKKTKTGWKLANPATEARSLATQKRKHNTEGGAVLPKMEDFSNADRNRIMNYFQQAKRGEHTVYTTKNKPAEFPMSIYKNSRKPVVKKEPKPEGTGVSKIPAKKPVVLKKPEPESESESESEDEKKRESSSESESNTDSESDSEDEEEHGGALWDKIKEFVKPRQESTAEQTLTDQELKDLLNKSYEKELSDYGDYKVDRDISNPITQVYYNEKKKHPVVVHRGSWDMQDWIENANYGLLNKKEGSHFKTAEDTQRKAETKYGTDNLTTIGHSKGSVHAQEFGKRGKQIITLNKPVNPYEILQKVPENQIDIKLGGDPVSILRGLQLGKKARVLKSKSYNPHSIEGLGLREDIINFVRRLRGLPARIDPMPVANQAPPPPIQVVAQPESEMTPEIHREIQKLIPYYPSIPSTNPQDYAMTQIELEDAFDKADEDREKRNKIIMGASGLKPVDWEDIKWGSFTNQFKRFKQQHPNSHIKDLEDFANMIVENPGKFAKTTFRRASFYLNVLLHRK